MTRATVILLLVTLMLGSQSRAVPLRGHGGVIFGSEFLRILDPRARPPARSNPYETPGAASTTLHEGGVVAHPTSEHETRTLLETRGGKPTQDSLTFSSGHSHNSSPIVSSSQISSSSSSSSSTDSVFQQLDSSPGVKQHPRRLPQKTVDSNRLIPIKKFTTSNSNNVKSTISSILDGRDNARGTLAVTNHPDNLPNDDYDYTYYLDDLYPLTSSALESGKESVTAGDVLPQASNNQQSTKAMPEVEADSRVTQSAPLIDITLPGTSHKLERKRAGTRLATSVALAINETASTTITPQKTIMFTTTKRPTTKRSVFRYQTTTESAQKIKITEENSTMSQNPTSERISKVPSSPRESSSASTSLSQKLLGTSDTLVEVPKSRTSVTVRASARSSLLVTPSPLTVKTKEIPVSTKSLLVVTTQVSEQEVHDAAQKLKGASSNVLGNFRYTTAVPKNESRENESNTHEVITQGNTLKSLEGSSSSSVVVEVRVEAPRREPRVLATGDAVPLIQTVTRGTTKVSSLPSRTVHAVNSDRHPTSFLLSDPLVVDVAAEPTTSDHSPNSVPPRRHLVVLPKDETTTPSTTTTTIITASETTTLSEMTHTSIHSETTSTTTTPNEMTTTPLTTTTTTTATTNSTEVPPQLDQVKGLSSNKALEEIQVNRGKDRSVQFETSVVEVSGSVGSDAHILTGEVIETQAQSQPESRERDGRILEIKNSNPHQQFQSQRVSTSVSRTEARTAGHVSSVNSRETIPQPISTTTIPQSSTTTNTTANVETTSSGNSSLPRVRLSLVSSPKAQHGLAPFGQAPFGQAPGGLAPFGNSPSGLAPHGLVPGGLHPHGLAPKGYGIKRPSLSNLNTTTTSTKAPQSSGTRLTFVDATVAEGGADANSTVGYVVEEHNISRFRLEEKTPDGFIIGEYGVVDHSTGDVNGVRYTADSTADPHLIYETLMKFLEL
ncbi:uncharacterized protein [Cherax quadricarinatus]|uniref:uncharacterized protein isoform X2 n=1 Tax=Cherax quadricarinatus TaxID=27406 RepID=UPI00387EC923